MTFLSAQWNDEYALGIESIDIQHKKLFAIMEQMTLLDGSSPTIKEEIRTILYELSEYMQQHFSDEELYMEKIGFSELDYHKKLHHAIIEQVKSVVTGGSNLGIIQTKLKFMIKQALIDHIVHEDMKIKLQQCQKIEPSDELIREIETV